MLGQCSVPTEVVQYICSIEQWNTKRQDVLVSFMTKVGTSKSFQGPGSADECHVSVSHNPGIFMCTQPPLVDSITLRKKTFKGSIMTSKLCRCTFLKCKSKIKVLQIAK